MASEQGHLNIVKILLQHHARVDIFDEVSDVASFLLNTCSQCAVCRVLQHSSTVCIIRILLWTIKYA